jgi:hypothetical protein
VIAVISCSISRLRIADDHGWVHFSSAVNHCSCPGASRVRRLARFGNAPILRGGETAPSIGNRRALRLTRPLIPVDNPFADGSIVFRILKARFDSRPINPRISECSPTEVALTRGETGDLSRRKGLT